MTGPECVTLRSSIHKHTIIVEIVIFTEPSAYNKQRKSTTSSLCLNHEDPVKNDHKVSSPNLCRRHLQECGTIILIRSLAAG